MKKFFKGLLLLLILLIIVYFAGPKAPKAKIDAELPIINATTQTVEAYVALQEAQVENIKPNNASSIVWADSVGQKTPYVLVYLHGFSASPMEGDPIHFETAERYDCNLYLPRLYGHGIATEDAFLDLTPEKLMATAKEAIAVGKLLGDSLILMSCSTGGTLSLYLAAHHPEIAGIITYAPNIDIADKTSAVLVMPWGLQLTRKAMGGKYREFAASDEAKKYWTHRYRLEGLVALKSLLKATMKESTFQAIKQPVFAGYYYKNEDEKDDIVSIDRINEMFEQLGTPDKLKRKVAFANANTHVINSKLMSEEIERVRQETFKFCEEVLGLQAKD
ncbi:MAG: alpha/beta hydrolase [Chitinophagales bacterium]